MISAGLLCSFPRSLAEAEYAATEAADDDGTPLTARLHSRAEVEAELAEYDQRLAALYKKMETAKGDDSASLQDEMWEVQRRVTQLKRQVAMADYFVGSY